MRVALGGLASSGVGVVAGRIGFLVGGGAAPGGRLGSGVGRPVGVAATPGGGVARAWVVGRWGRVAGGGGGAGVAGGGGAGGGGGGVGGVVVVVVVVVVVLGVVVVVVVVVVVRVVVVVVLRVCPQDPLALRWDKGLGHHSHPLGLQGLVDSWGGFGVGFDRDRG